MPGKDQEGASSDEDGEGGAETDRGLEDEGGEESQGTYGQDDALTGEGQDQNREQGTKRRT